MSQQFSQKQLEILFRLATFLKGLLAKGMRVDWLRNHIIATLFYEPSTRTRFSFETAALRLGAGVIASENAAEFSSAIKGETLSDTIRIMSDKADLIVLRHKRNDAALEAAKVSGSSPIINGGSGTLQHPTQALLDVFTIQEHFGKVSGLKVAMVGDLKRGRTVKSLAYLLSKYKGVEIIFIAPTITQMTRDIKDHLNENKIKWSEDNDLLKVVAKADVVYMTRYQLERAESPEEKEQLKKASESHIMNRTVANAMPENSIIMHPLPRIEEIRWSVDSNPRARYFQQAANGDYIRMALLLCILNPQKAEELLAA
ncbi:MAG: aspartate carbamoyltransferase [Candidatus Buchananbacteria bacterium RBG_13_39_9]|uniref:Aspartate carbamoyltransferase n=1 Tax=Candidatus Buchananbacteria bacterium RBG_13_39_9 TaxID=1797531 RepID=A0A1G1XP74_9BACT|nr:MAG: aspartate carbamoyltransferase [Candidatus Buchananbacteria bacterium RBG_13_39_9]